MSEDKLVTKIRALFRLAANNPNEHEAASAMQKAQALMNEHNITLGAEIDAGVRKLNVVRGEYHRGLRDEYRGLGASVAHLFQCKFAWQLKDDELWMMGGEETAVVVATETFIWIVSQIEVFYKDALKNFGGSLTKSQRAELRKTFKGAAADRVSYRVRQMIGANARAIVLVSDEDLTAVMNITKTFTTKKAKVGMGTALGTLAGESVQIRKEVSA